MSEDANDVSKALAAFGAPSIRYHSFGQASMKPSPLGVPRRPAATTLPPVVTETAPGVAQAEPVAAPEPLVEAHAVPAPTVAPRPAPVFRESSAVRPQPLFPPAPTVAPPPRPLAEWAAPVTAIPTRAPVVSPVFTAPAATRAPVESLTPAPAPHIEPRHVPSPLPEPAPAPLAAHFPAASSGTVSTPAAAVRRPATARYSSSLTDIFEFLAAS